jgi:hypothetical protein
MMLACRIVRVHFGNTSAIRSPKMIAMKIEFELKYKDILLCNIMHQFFSVPIQLFYCGLGVSTFYMLRGELSLEVSIISAIFAYLAMWVVQLLFLVFYLCFGTNRSLFTQHIVAIQDDAFYEETQFGKSYQVWGGLAKVISRPGYIAVYTNANAAHILPNRAFSSSEHRQEFLAALQGKLSKA